MVIGVDDILIMAAISAAATAGGGILANQGREEQANSANQWGLWMQREGQQFNAQMAEQTWLRNLEQWYRSADYNTQMSNTAYQRAMKDMRAAGLNPMLAYQQGGATSPAAPSAVATSASSPGFTPGAKADVQDVLGPAVNSAMHAMRTVQGVQSAQEEIKQTQANTALQQVQAGREAAATANITQQTASEAVRTGLLKEETARTVAQQALTQAQTGAAAAQAGLATAQTRTEGQRPEYVYQQGRRERWEAESAYQEAERFRQWGPRSAVTDAGASAEAISNRIQRTMREGLGPILRVNP